MISVLLFLLLHAAPGGPLGPYLQNPHITAADIKRLEHNFGLDRPIYVQYLGWLGKVVSGDLGYSTSNSESVVQAIGERIPATLLLMGTSLTISIVLGVTFGIVAALRPYSFIDYAVTSFAFFGQSMPVFWFALMMQLFFAVNGLTIGDYHFALPSAGIAANEDVVDIGDRLVHLILPAVVLSLLNLAIFSRFTRSSMLEVIRTDFVRTARSKGVSQTGVVLRHALRNSLVPVVTIAALTMPSLLGGAVITEGIFAWPGTGRLFLNGLSNFDFSLLMAILILNAALVVLFNLLADVAYAYLDPRVSYD